MKSKSKKIIRLIKLSLDVAWFGNFLLAAIGFATLGYLSFFLPSNKYTEMSSHVRMIGKNYVFTKAVVGSSQDVRNGFLSTNEAYFSYEIRSTPFVEVSAFFLLICFELLAFSIIYHLRRLFASLDRGIPFTSENVRTLKRVGWLIALILPVQLINYLCERYFVNKNFPASYHFSVEPGLNFWTLVVAVILYIVAEIFNYGLELQQENEEFV